MLHPKKKTQNIVIKHRNPCVIFYNTGPGLKSVLGSVFFLHTIFCSVELTKIEQTEKIANFKPDRTRN